MLKYNHPKSVFNLVGFQLATGCDISNSTKCNPELLKCCGTQLKNDLGLQNCNGLLAYEPECHREEIEAMYANGIDGLFKVCDSFNKYYECLGDARKDCTSVGFHVQMDLHITDAINVASMYKQFGFACGAGFDGFSNNDLCMSEIFKTRQPQITECRNQFRNNLIIGSRNHCLYLDEFVGCFTNVFDHSLCNRESSWWGCEYARQSGKVVLNDCDLQCHCK
ncbi:unnamed protein product [Caenorhabditis bovis]|uniref:DUF19 domain-containing protein n=1 Tax=Caenorhabditis bovis TaxID=2654633 RepID=A0A8S1EH83_9PELO|nr:unnamed protein product [Caenorhabditis bovis]